MISILILIGSLFLMVSSLIAISFLKLTLDSMFKKSNMKELKANKILEVSNKTPLLIIMFSLVLSLLIGISSVILSIYMVIHLTSVYSIKNDETNHIEDFKKAEQDFNFTKFTKFQFDNSIKLNKYSKQNFNKYKIIRYDNNFSSNTMYIYLKAVDSDTKPKSLAIYSKINKDMFKDKIVIREKLISKEYKNYFTVDYLYINTEKNKIGTYFEPNDFNELFKAEKIKEKVIH